MPEQVSVKLNNCFDTLFIQLLKKKIIFQVQPVLSFTFEEEFRVMDYIVRIEQYQNRRFEFVENKFPLYNRLVRERFDQGVI